MAKEAFCLALEGVLAAVRARPAFLYTDRLEAAYGAFQRDHSYSAAIAKSAVDIRAKKYTGDLRSAVRDSVHQAMSECTERNGELVCSEPGPCGTGGCQFATGDLALVQITTRPGRHVRPGNHVQAGESFSSDDIVPELEKVCPFHVAA